MLSPHMLTWRGATSPERPTRRLSRHLTLRLQQGLCVRARPDADARFLCWFCWVSMLLCFTCLFGCPAKGLRLRDEIRVPDWDMSIPLPATASVTGTQRCAQPVANAPVAMASRSRPNLSKSGPQRRKAAIYFRRPLVSTGCPNSPTLASHRSRPVSQRKQAETRLRRRSQSPRHYIDPVRPCRP